MIIKNTFLTKLCNTCLNLTSCVLAPCKSRKFDSIASLTAFGYWGDFYLPQLRATIVNPDSQSKMATITMQRLREAIC